MDEEPRVSFATAESWGALAASYTRVWDDALAGMDFAAMIADLDIPEEPRAAAAFLINHVNSRVRYTGLYLGDRAIIPTDPQTVWNRGYGDCKDKAVLVTGLLRAAGFEVHPALLHTESEVDADLPGMGAFNHVIVHLPGDLWLDPTQEYAREGILPAGLGGRRALVVRPDTTGLVEIPTSRPEDNEETLTLVYELRDGEDGDIRYHWVGRGVSETSQRQNNADSDREEREANLTDTFGAEAIRDFEWLPVDDFSQPWQESFTVVRSEYLDADYHEIAATIPINWLLADLTPYLFYEIEDDEDMRFEVEQPGIYNLEVRIEPHEGFVLTRAHEDFLIEGGPFSMTLSVSEGDRPGLTCSLRIESGTWDPESFEHVSARAYEEIETLPQFFFQHRSTVLADEGKTTDAFAMLRENAVASPESVPARLRLGYLFDRFGLIEPARKWMLSAHQREPESVYRLHSSAYVLMRDYMDNQLRGDLPLDELAEIIEKIEQIEDLPPTTAAMVALNLEQDGFGFYRTDRAILDKAFERYVSIGDTLGEAGYGNNVLVNRFLVGDFDAVRKYREHGDPNFYNGLDLAITLLERGKTAFTRKLRNIPSGQKQVFALLHASDQLSRLRKYPESKLVLDRLEGQLDNPILDLRREVLGNAEIVDLETLPEDRPETPVERMIASLVSPQTRPDFANSFVAPAFADNFGDIDFIETIIEQTKVSGSLSGLTVPHIQDVMIAFFEKESREIAPDCHLVTLKFRQEPDVYSETYCVVDNGEGFRILTATSNIYQVGEGVRHALENDEPEWARALVSHYFDGILGADHVHHDSVTRYAEYLRQRGTPDDRAMMILMTSPGEHTKKDLSYLKKMIARAEDEKVRIGLEIIRAEALFFTGKREKTVQMIQAMLDEVEDTELVSDLHADLFFFLTVMGRYDAAEQLLEEMPEATGFEKSIKKRRQIDIAMAKGDVAETRSVIDTYREDETVPRIANSAGWIALFEDKGFEREIENMTRDQGPETSAANHTLACLYARNGDYDKAVQTIRGVIKQEQRDRPEDDDWLVYGIIAEKLGFPEYARAYYGRVETDDRDNPFSSYSLARQYLDGLPPADPNQTQFASFDL